LNPLYAIINLFIYNNIIYKEYINIINIKYIQDNNKDLYKIFKVLPIFKEKVGVGNLDNFSLFFFSQYPGMKGDEVTMYLSLFEKISTTKADEASVLEYLNSLRQKEIAHKIAITAIDVAEGRKDFSEIQKLAGEAGRVEDDLKIEFVNSSLQDIYDKTLHQAGFRWRLETLNRMLGSLRQGNFGFIFARPETGKTTFLASEISFMAGQTNRPILWVNNEEVGSVVLSRCYQAALGVNQQDLYSSLAENEAKYKELTGDRIKIIDDASISKKDVEAICERLKPALIIFDQIDKIRGFEGDRYDLVMKEIYRWARALAKTYGPVIGICQAGGTAEGKKWLTMNDVDSSHTAKQGEADFILGIGKVEDEAFQNTRYFSICKNKLPGDEDTMPQLRHGKIDVIIIPEIARYKDRMVWK
jgi:replicative DNA helicase